MKMWSGRFSKELDAGVNDFNSSIACDHVMYHEDIMGSIAHATMLGKCGIIPQADSDALIEGLEGILADLDSGSLQFDLTAEDIHMFVEQVLTERIGDPGKRLHTARSRNDQVALDIRMYLKKQLADIYTQVHRLIDAILIKAEQNLDTVMPGYTHLQVAQPITFSHHIMAYAQMFTRDLGRLNDCCHRMDVMPLGSGALASTTYPIDRTMVAELLGFSGGVTQNSLDGVSDRDFCVEAAAALSLIMTHLSRFSEEIILWCTSEFRFIELDDAFATGSSIMPQKKNPDITELIRGKTGRVNGDLLALLTMLKGLPLAYNKDMQEDKEAVFDSIETTRLCLNTFIPMLETMTVKKENMRAAAAKGFINATDCADYLTKKGVPFREAYQITGFLVKLCIERGCTLESLPLDAYRELSNIFSADLYHAIDLGTCVEQRNVIGGPAPNAVKAQIAELKTRLTVIDGNRTY
ncbi:MAG: argininosuccinate lyase [Candidatus Fimivivens sp.]